MTPRDHYAAVLMAAIHTDSDYAAGSVSDHAQRAVDLADALAKAACQRWGHDLDDHSRSSRCIRCGELDIVTCDDCGRPKGSGRDTCDCIPF